jgi:hypothetical protein
MLRGQSKKLSDVPLTPEQPASTPPPRHSVLLPASQQHLRLLYLSNRGDYGRIMYFSYRVTEQQSAKLFSSRRNLDSPNPSPAGENAPPPLVPGGGAHSLAREGVGESQFRRGDIHCIVLCKYMYFVYRVLQKNPYRNSSLCTKHKCHSLFKSFSR